MRIHAVQGRIEPDQLVRVQLRSRGQLHQLGGLPVGIAVLAVSDGHRLQRRLRQFVR